MITRAIEACFKKAKAKKWNKTFWAIDIHDTILEANYSEELPTNWLPFAKEAIQMMSDREDIELILYTCSWPKEIEKYLEFFRKEGIIFKFANNNTDVKNTGYGYYDNKPYFNVLFEDKAGFHHDDWPSVIRLLNRYPDGYGISEAVVFPDTSEECLYPDCMCGTINCKNK